VINIAQITKSYTGSETPALKEISFSINRGETVAILGENGAGKTTLLRIISTILKPTAGTCTVNGFDVLKEPQKVKASIGILLGSETGLYDRLTARENIEYFAKLHGIDKKVYTAELEKLSDLMNMTSWLNKKADKLSRGMKQKTALARAVIHRPPVLILDEPTTGLDVTSTSVFHRFMENYKSEGGTLIFSSHTISEVEKIADRVIIISDEQIRENGTVAELTEKHSAPLENLFRKIIGMDNEI